MQRSDFAQVLERLTLPCTSK